jgi:hypothetical protein
VRSACSDQRRLTVTAVTVGGEQQLWGLTASSWEAIGTWATVAVAVVAAVAAVRQITAAKDARVEEARAYIAVFMEFSGASSRMIELVIRNFGRTAAFDVRVTTSPAIQCSGVREVVWLPGVIPTLAPGQEWRTLWDFAPNYLGADLPQQYDVTVSFRTVDGSEQTYSYSLDWGAYRGVVNVQVHSVHDGVTALREMRDSMKHWGEGINGLRVYVRDGESKDERERLQWEEAMIEAQADPDFGPRLSSGASGSDPQPTGAPPDDQDEARSD